MPDLKRCVDLCARTYAENAPVIVEGDHIAFRGTANLHEWMQDGRFLLTSWPPGMVHEGFVEALRERWPTVRKLAPWIYERCAAPAPTITGHSLGGAIAILAAAYLRQLSYSVEVVTFGCPKIGDAAFAASIDFPVTRVVNDHDVVPHLPPLIEYHHVGVLNWFDAAGVCHWPTASPLQFAPRVSDHHIERYQRLFP